MQKYVAAAMLTALAFTVAACGKTQAALPTTPSLMVNSLDGTWGGPMTLTSVSGGECTGAVAPSVFGPTDDATLSFTQDGAAVQGSITAQRTGFSCALAGSSTATGVTLNATSCNTTGLAVTCVDGSVRELRLVGSVVTGFNYGGTISGSVGTTYNVWTVGSNAVQVGSLVVDHSFSATRR
jgi:hypothetical protein